MDGGIYMEVGGRYMGGEIYMEVGGRYMGVGIYMEVGDTWVEESIQKSMTPNILNIRICYRKNKIKSIQESKDRQIQFKEQKASQRYRD